MLCAAKLIGLAAALAAVGFSAAAQQLIVPITAYPHFSNPCFAYTTSSGSSPVQSRAIGSLVGPCSGGSGVILFSVTQEDDFGNHDASINFKRNQSKYMADYLFPQMLGTTLNMHGGDGQVVLSFDTTANPKKLNPVTGWPVAFGYTFVGANDITTPPTATLDKNIYLKFRVQVPRAVVGSEWSGFSGFRIFVGGELDWPEGLNPDGSRRTNRSHYIEIVLGDVPGYGARLRGREGTPGCTDAPYYNCFFDAQGRYAEGRYVTGTYLGLPPLSLGTDAVVDIAIPLSETVRSLAWISPPTDWRLARIGGFYLAIEGTGQAAVTAVFSNWLPFWQPPPQNPNRLPLGLTRYRGQVVLSDGSGSCVLPNGAELAAYGFEPPRYDRAVRLKALPAGLLECERPATPVLPKLVRIAEGAYLRSAYWYCLIRNRVQLATLGFDQSDFDTAPQFYPPAEGLEFTGICRA